MFPRARQAILFAVVLAVAACTPPGFLTGPTRTSVEGNIRAPIAALFPSAGGNGTAPVKDATVYLLDETGRLVHEVKAVATDSQGRYRLEGVPVGKTFVIAAVTPGEGGQMVVLKSLVQTTEATAGQAVDIDLGSTVATDAVAKLGPEGLNFAKVEDFKKAQAAIGSTVGTAGAPVPNLTGAGGSQAALEAWLKANPGAAAAVKALEAAIAANSAAAKANGGTTPGTIGTIPGTTPQFTPFPDFSSTPRPQRTASVMPDATPTPTPTISMKPVDRATIFIDARHRYLPHTTFLKVGGAAVFVNQADTEHRITPLEPGAFEDTGGIQPKAVSKAVTFDTPGEYGFQCELHGASQGKIVVVAE